MPGVAMAVFVLGVVSLGAFFWRQFTRDQRRERERRDRGFEVVMPVHRDAKR